MFFSFVSYDSETGSPHRVYFDSDPANIMSAPKISPKMQDRINNYPVLASIVGKLKIIKIGIVLDDADTTPGTKRNTLAGIFNPTDYSGELKELIAQNTETTAGTQYKLMCICIGFEWEPDGKKIMVTLAAPNPLWQSTTLTTFSWLNPSSGDSTTDTTGGLVVAGNQEINPIIEVTLTGVRTGTSQIYRRFVVMRNPTGKPFFNKHVNLANAETNNGLNTAAINGAKSDTDLFGFLVQVNGTYRDRWINDVNDTGGSPIHVRLSMRGKLEPTLGVALSSTGGETEIELADTPRNRRIMRQLPQKGQVYIGSELILFNNVDDVAEKYDPAELKIRNIKRAAFGTSLAAHSVGVTVYWIEKRIWLVYGDTGSYTVSQNSPDADQMAPMYLLSSTNFKHSYSSTGDGFADRKDMRGDEFHPEDVVLKKPTGKRFRGDNDGLGVYTNVHANTGVNTIPAYVNPALYLGLTLRALEDGNTYVFTRAAVGWNYRHPWGITDVTITGQKFSTTTGDWVKFLGLKASLKGKNWKEIWSEAALATGNEWADFSTGVQTIKTSLGGTYNHIMLEMRGGQNGGATRHQALAEVSKVDIWLSTGNAPVVAILAERTAQVEIKNFKLKNNSFSPAEVLRIRRLTMSVDTKLKINTATGKAYIDDNGQRNILGSIETNTNRAALFRLIKGTNQVVFTDAGVGNLLVEVLWNDRIN